MRKAWDAWVVGDPGVVELLGFRKACILDVSIEGKGSDALERRYIFLFSC